MAVGGLERKGTWGLRSGWKELIDHVEGKQCSFEVVKVNATVMMRSSIFLAFGIGKK